MSRRNYWTTLRQRKISRRTMLGASAKAGVGAAGLALVGCGDDDGPDAGAVAAERAAAAAEEAAAAAVAAGDARAAESAAAAAVAAEAADAAGEASAAAADAADAAGEASAAASQAASAADAAAALAAEAAESEDAGNAAAAAEAAAAAAAQAADAAGAAGDAAAAAVADAAAEAAEAAAQAARDVAAAVEAGTATAEAAQAAIDNAAEAAAAAAAAAGEASAAAGAAAAAAGEAAATAQETAEAAAETAAAAVAAAQEAADAAQEAAESAAMAAEEEDEPAAAGGPVYGGKIVRSANADIDQGWNPSRSTSGADGLNYFQYIYDNVLGYTDDGSGKAELAESWETPDDVTYLFNFAPGRAVFQDGAPVDANAMQANMEFLQTDEEASLNARTNSGLANAASFGAVDDVTWRMVNSEPVGPTLAAFWTPGLSGALISPNAFETAHTDPVGAGPARPVEYRVGEHWLGEKWDGYWDNEHVYADQLETRVVPDPNNGWAQFLDGEISYARPPGVMTRDLAAELEADGFQVATGVGQGWNAQWFNLNPAAEGFNMFRDPRLRWAFGLSVDRDVVNDLSMDGLGRVPVCNTSTESWAIREGANYYDPPDLAKAAQLRDAAGFGDDNPVTGDILSYSWDLALLTAQAVFAQLQQAGWSGLNFFTGSESAVLDRFFPANDHVAATLTWNSPFDPDATTTPTVDLVLKNWMYGSPADGPGTGRASLADYPNDQVLQDIAETEELNHAATKFASQEDRIEPYDKAFASFGNGHSWSDPDIQGHHWTYNWIQFAAGFGAQENLEGGFKARPVDGWSSSSSGGHGYKGLWHNV